MAVYLSSFSDKAISRPDQDALAAKSKHHRHQVVAASATGARLYQGACAV